MATVRILEVLTRLEELVVRSLIRYVNSGRYEGLRRHFLFIWEVDFPSFARNSLCLQCDYCLRNLPKHSFDEHNVRCVCQLLCFTSQVLSVCPVTGIVASDLAAEHNGLTVRDRRVAASR